jgi:hypothetical protein
VVRGREEVVVVRGREEVVVTRLVGGDVCGLLSDGGRGEERLSERC